MRLLVLSPSLLGVGICRVLEEHESSWVVRVERAPDPEVIAQRCQSYAPHVSILEDGNVLTLFEHLGRPGVGRLGRIIVITVSGLDEERLFLLMKWGGCGCLDPTATAQDLVTRVERVEAGEYLLSLDCLYNAKPRPMHILKESGPKTSREAAPLALPSPLSPREAEVLFALAQGLRNRDLAVALGNLSAHTIKDHLTVIFRKLQVDNRTAAVFQALSLRWISMPEVFYATRQRSAKRKITTL